MKRIAIVGPPGAGKTTLALELSSLLKIKQFHLDRIFWERGWKKKERDTKIDILQKLVGEPQWIIEGYYLKSSEPRLESADTIIFLDMPPFLCLHRLWKRHHVRRSRRDIPPECTDKFTPYSVLKILSFLIQRRVPFLRKLKKYEKTKHVVRLHSPEEVHAFLIKFNGTGTITAKNTGSKQQKALSHYNYGPEGKVLVGSKR